MVDIIGGGIGGLTLGVALQQQKIDFRIFEQAAELRPVGAGIILGNNVMQLYESLQIREQLEAVANPIHELQITRPDLRPLSKVKLAPFVERYGVHNLAIHRGALQQVLLDQLPEHALQLVKELTSLEQGDQLQLHFSDGSRINSSALVGADGIYSAVRQRVFPQGRIRAAQQMCWRGLAKVEIPAQEVHLVREAWGRGNRFGIVPLAGGQVYWFAVQTIAAQQAAAENYDLQEIFADYAPLIKELIAATPAASIHEAPLEDLQLKGPWYKDNIALLGDAAHAMTPNMGQGAGQAIEDACLLAVALGKYEQVEAAFQAYYAARKKKVGKIVTSSWQVGQLAHWRHGLAVAVRTALMRSTPAWVSQRQLASVFKLNGL